MNRTKRIVVVTAGLAGTGVLVGAVCGIIAGVLVLAPFGALRLLRDPEFYALTALLGGGLGGAVAPVLSWGLLRYVPLGRAIAWTALGSVIGGAAGFTWLHMRYGPFYGAIGGFLVAAIVLRLRYRRPASRLPEADSSSP